MKNSGNMKADILISFMLPAELHTCFWVYFPGKIQLHDMQRSLAFMIFLFASLRQKNIKWFVQSVLMLLFL